MLAFRFKTNRMFKKNKLASAGSRASLPVRKKQIAVARRKKDQKTKSIIIKASRQEEREVIISPVSKIQELLY